MSTRISGLLLSVRNCHAGVHEDCNRADSFAVAVVRGETIVGHVPKKILISLLSLSTLGGLDRLSIDNRPTEKGLETPQIFPGIDVTTRN